MVATAGSTSNRSSGGRRLTACDGSLRCVCGYEPVVRTSSTTRNFGKRFYGCPSYNGTPGSGGEFFIWVTEGMCAHSTEIAVRATRKLLEAEAHLNHVKTTYRIIILFMSLAVVGAFFAGKMSV